MPSDAQRRANLKYWRANRDELNAEKRARYKAIPELRVRKNALARVRLKANPHKRSRKRTEEGKRARKRQAEEYRKANRDKLNASAREYSKAYRKANRDRVLAAQRAWHRANPDKKATRERNRRARKRLAEGTHTSAETAAIRRSQKNRCVYCKVELGRHGHLDHIIPLARGGSNDRKNLQWLCAECNIRKGAKDPIEFARANGMLI